MLMDQKEHTVLVTLRASSPPKPEAGTAAAAATGAVKKEFAEGRGVLRIKMHCSER